MQAALPRASRGLHLNHRFLASAVIHPRRADIPVRSLKLPPQPTFVKLKLRVKAHLL